MGAPVIVRAVLMGSPFTIAAYPSAAMDAAATRAALCLGLAEIRRLEDLMTEFRESPLTMVNASAGKCPVRVPHELFVLIARSLHYAEVSRGAFDITSAVVGQLWRTAQECGAAPSPREIARVAALVDYRAIELNARACTVYLAKPGMRISLGGIGKGYAVDQAFDMLRRLGVRNFFVNGAGDIRVHSADDAPRPWRIGLRNPFGVRGHAIGSVQLVRGAIASSGDYERGAVINNVQHSHIVPHADFDVAQRVASVTILADAACLADVLATSVMSLGLSEGLRYLNTCRGVTGYCIDMQGNVHLARNWKGEVRDAARRHS